MRLTNGISLRSSLFLPVGTITYLQTLKVCPDGMVLFLPSYDYEEKLYRTWEQLGVLDKIEAKKKIFREPKESSDVDAVLEAYGQCIAEGSRGSLMMSVRCAFFDRNLHSRMPLSFTPMLHLLV
jgi:hypothetical protein